MALTLWDVNIWVYAFRTDSPKHQRSRNLLLQALEERDSFLFNSGVATSFLRLVTNPRIFVQPSSLDEAWSFIDVLQNHPAAISAELDPMGFGIFKHLTLSYNTKGNLVPDAMLAALAMRHGAKIVSFDRGFLRYKHLELKILD